MTFLSIVSGLSQRFLSHRSFELIVMPALDDFTYEQQTSNPGSYVAVLTAVAGAAWEDVVRSGALRTFAGLVMIPICYHAFLFVLLQPQGLDQLSGLHMLVLGGSFVTLSLGLVLVCYWPAREPRQPRIE